MQRTEALTLHACALLRDAILQVAENGQILAAHGAVQRVLGAHLLSGKHLTQLFPGLQVDAECDELAALRKMLLNGRSEHSLRVLGPPLGDSATVHELDIVADGHGYVVIVHDPRAARNERWLQQMLEISSDAILLVDESDRVRYWNSAASQVFGYTAEEILGTDVRQIVHAACAADLQSRLQAARFGARTLPFDSKRVARSGECVEVRTQILAISAEGEPPLLCVVDRDVSVLKRLESLARDHQAHLHRLVQSAVDSIVTIASDGTIESFNAAAERLFGYTGAEVIGQNVRILMPEPYRGEHDSYLKRFLNTRHARIIGVGREAVGQRSDGSTFPIELCISQFELDGQQKFTGVLRDITDRKAAEHKLRDYAQMLEQANATLSRAMVEVESSSRLKSEFLTNISHEIRTPLNAIIGFAELLAEREHSAEDRESIDAIQRNGAHLLALVNDLLDLSKIEAGTLNVECVPCKPRTVLDEVLALTRPRAEERKLALGTRILDDVPETVQSDPTRLRQILLNLVSNAIKFTREGGVTIGARAAGTPQEPLLEFNVIDTGIGMSAAQRERVLRPFEQADGSTTRRFGGTGLGLTISKRLAQLLGGDLEIAESAPNQGTTVRFWIRQALEDPGSAVLVPARTTFEELPVAAPSDREAPGAAHAELDTPLSCRVLLAEDGPDNQRLFTHVLLKAGAQVQVVDNGREALDRVVSQGVDASPFDVVLMDMQMPEMDGYEAARRLRAAGFSRPIVAITAHAMATDRAKCLEAGCSHYLTKPLNRRRLLATLASIAREALPAVVAPAAAGSSVDAQVELATPPIGIG